MLLSDGKKKSDHTQSQLDGQQASHANCRKELKSTQNPHTEGRKMNFSEQNITLLVEVTENLEPIGTDGLKETFIDHKERYRGVERMSNHSDDKLRHWRTNNILLEIPVLQTVFVAQNVTEST